MSPSGNLMSSVAFFSCDLRHNFAVCFSLLPRTQLKIHAASHLRYEVVARIGLGTTESLTEEAHGKFRVAGPIR
jgi:hypothetical protein